MVYVFALKATEFACSLTDNEAGQVQHERIGRGDGQQPAENERSADQQGGVLATDAFGQEAGRYGANQSANGQKGGDPGF